MDTGGRAERHRRWSPALTSPADVSAPIDVLVTWNEGWGLPPDWDQTVASWPERVPEELPGDLHHTRAIHDGTTVGVHVASARRPGQLHGVWCAVDPAWRRRGLAQRLIARHIRWATDHDRLHVRSHTRAACIPMLVANLKAGLGVVGSFTAADGEVLVIFQAQR